MIEAGLSNVKRALTMILCLAAMSSARAADLLLLTDQPAAAPDAWQTAPSLDGMVWQPDRLLRTGSRTVDEAAETLATALLAAPDAPDWLRLETFDLTAVGDCETCQPPPLDPHAYRPLTAPANLDPRQYAFFAAVAERLRTTRFHPVVVIPAGGAPSPVRLPDNLTILLAGPGGPEGFASQTIAARAEQWTAWQAAGFKSHSLIADGLGEFYGLPLNGDLLRQQAAALPHPAVAVRDAATFTATGPDWLTARLTAVVVGGETTPQGDLWRADEPRLAQAVDVFAPVADRLGDAPAEQLAAVTLLALEAIHAWNLARAAGTAATGEAAEALARRAALRGGWEPGGPLSKAFVDFLERAGPLPNLVLDPTHGVEFDGFLNEGEWRGATRLELATGPYGQASDRPATVWLAADSDALSLAVIATEPDPADSTLADRLVLRLSDGESGLVRIELPVGQRPTIGGEPLGGIVKQAVFDGPGWVMEARLPWSAIGLAPGALRALGLATEHRTGSLRTVTAWCPDGGGAQVVERLARVRVR